MISFTDYYKQQFKDIPKIWRLAKKHRKYLEFIFAVIQLFTPAVIYTMYLYDTGQVEVDKRFCKGE